MLGTLEPRASAGRAGCACTHVSHTVHVCMRVRARVHARAHACTRPHAALAHRLHLEPSLLPGVKKLRPAPPPQPLKSRREKSGARAGGWPQPGPRELGSQVREGPERCGYDLPHFLGCSHGPQHECSLRDLGGSFHKAQQVEGCRTPE